MAEWKNKSMQACIDLVPICPRNAVDLERMYERPQKAFGGGKSGAFVFLLDSKRVLKYYTDAFKFDESKGRTMRTTGFLGQPEYIPSDDWPHDNQRPFREFLAMCRMSGIRGFPKVYDVFCATSPNTWISSFGLPLPETKFGLAVVSSIAPGSALIRLNDRELNMMTPKTSLMVGLGMLYLLNDAKKAMGPDFEHFDLHPDNVFVDLKTIIHYDFIPDEKSGERFAWDGPLVSLIDFDLVEGDYKGYFDEDGPPGEHASKREIKLRDGRVARIPAERTINFLQKLVGTGPSMSQIMAEADIIKNTDIRNWFVTLSGMFYHSLREEKKAAEPLIGCQDIAQCLNLNKQFDQFRAMSGVASRSRKRLREQATQSRSRRIRREGIPYLGSLINNQRLAPLLREYNQKVYRQTHVFPTYDDTVIDLYFKLKSTPIMLSLKVLDTKAVSFMMGSFGVSLYTKALSPKIEVNFYDPFTIRNNPRGFLELIGNFWTLKKLYDEGKLNKDNVRFDGKQITVDEFRRADVQIGIKKMTITPTDDGGTKVVMRLHSIERYLISKLGSFGRLGRMVTGLVGYFSGSRGVSIEQKDQDIVITKILPPPPEDQPTVIDLIMGWLQKSPAEQSADIKKWLIYFLYMLSFESTQRGMLTLYCAYNYPELKFSYLYERKQGGKKYMARGVNASRSFAQLFPSQRGITYRDILRSMRSADGLDTLRIVLNYTRQLCNMDAKERGEFLAQLRSIYPTMKRELGNILEMLESIPRDPSFYERQMKQAWEDVKMTPEERKHFEQSFRRERRGMREDIRRMAPEEKRYYEERAKQAWRDVRTDPTGSAYRMGPGGFRQQAKMEAEKSMHRTRRKIYTARRRRKEKEKEKAPRARKSGVPRARKSGGRVKSSGVKAMETD